MVVQYAHPHPRRPSDKSMTKHCAYHTFVNAAITSQPSSGGIGYSKAFLFSDIADATNLAQVWDQYKFESVTAKFIPRINTNTLIIPNGTGPLWSCMPIMEAPDYDDASVPTTSAVLSDKAETRCHSSFKEFTRKINPMMAQGVYGGGVFTSFSAVKPQWCDMASRGVEHYGIKCWVPAEPSGQSLHQQWDIWYTYHVALRMQQ